MVERRPDKYWWLPYVIFVVTTIIFFSGQLFGDAFFWNDFAEYVYPTRVFSAKAIADGSLPFWNPYSFSGTPFLADLQTGVFYPPYLLLDVIAGAGIYPIKLLQFVIILHFFIAQTAMYLLARRFNISLWGAMVAAVAYGFSSPLSLHTFHPMLVIHLAWFPLIFRFFHEGITERKALPAISAGLLLGMTMLSGSPQMTLFIIFFLGCAAVWYAFSSQGRAITGIGRSLALGVLAVAIGIGIFAIEYLPAQEFAALSERNEMTYEIATQGSLAFKQIVTAAVPKAFGHEVAPDTQENAAPFFLTNADPFLYWDTAFFFGIVTLFLGLYGSMTSWKRSDTKFFLIMALFGFVFALGEHSFIFKLFFNLPFFGSLRAPGRMMFFFTFGFCLLAGFGFDALWAERTKRSQARLIRAVALPAICVLGILIGILYNIPAEYRSAIGNFALTGLVLLAAGFAVALLAQRRKISMPIAGIVTAALIFADLFAANSSFNANRTDPRTDYANYLPPTLREMLLPKPPTEIFRVIARGPGLNALKRNQGLTDGIMMFEGYNQLLLAERYPRTTPNTMRDLLSIKYEVAFDSVNQRETFIERTGYFPNAWMVYRVDEVAAAELTHRMQDSISFADLAVTTAPLQITLSGRAAAEVRHTIACTKYSNNKLTYAVSTPEPGLLCLSEIWYPAWQAYVDGTPTQVHKINGCLRGVEVPLGDHIIELRYESARFATGSAISVATLVLTLGAMGLIRMRQRRKRPTVES